MLIITGFYILVNTVKFTESTDILKAIILYMEQRPKPKQFTLSDTELCLIDHIKEAGLLANPKIQIFAVGGWVRDKLLQKSCADLDLIVHWADFEKFFSEFKKVIQTNRKFELLPQSGNIFKPKSWKTKLVRMKLDLYDIDIKEYFSLHEDRVSRDFTINSIYFDIMNLNLINCQGIKDLDMRVIRSIAPPSECFKSVNRLLRLSRFIINFKFSPSETILNFFNKDPEISNPFGSVKVEGVFNERKKWLKSEMFFQYFLAFIKIKGYICLGFRDLEERFLKLKSIFKKLNRNLPNDNVNLERREELILSIICFFVGKDFAQIFANQNVLELISREIAFQKIIEQSRSFGFQYFSSSALNHNFKVCVSFAKDLFNSQSHGFDSLIHKIVVFLRGESSLTNKEYLNSIETFIFNHPALTNEIPELDDLKGITDLINDPTILQSPEECEQVVSDIEDFLSKIVELIDDYLKDPKVPKWFLSKVKPLLEKKRRISLGDISDETINLENLIRLDYANEYLQPVREIISIAFIKKYLTLPSINSTT